MLKKETLDQLEEALIDVVHKSSGQSWREKAEQITLELSDEGKSALSEFVGWFEGQGE